MKRIAILFMALCLSPAAMANHTWSGIDLCEVHKDRLPPGLTAAMLPEPQSTGAGLLQHYCTQCHNLPGPDRHSADEWHQVTANMFMLMEVSHRFGGLMGRVESLQQDEQTLLLAYLQRHAKRPTESKSINDTDPSKGARLAPLWVLLPFLLLTGLGMLRWWYNNRGTDHA